MARRGRTPWGRKRRRMMVVVVVLLTPLAIWLVWRLGVKGDYRDQMAALRAAGVPLTTEEREKWLDQWPLLPVCPEFVKSHEAYVPPAMEVLEALPRFVSRPRGGDGESTLSLVPYDPSELDAMSALVAGNGEVLRILREARLATELPCYGGHSTSEPIVELLCAAVCVRADEGNGAEAAEILLDGARYVRATAGDRKDPNGRWLTGWDGRLMGAFSSASLRTTFPEPLLRTLQGEMETTDWVAGQTFNIKSNLGWHVSEMAEMGQRNREAAVVNVLTGWFEKQTIWYSREQLAQLSVVGKPAREQVEILSKTPGLESDPFRVAGPVAHYQLSWLGLEIMCYHGTTGTLPESLAVLGLPVSRTVDFYGDGDFKYVVEGERFTLYSAGRDLEDDGGDVREDVVVMLGVGGS